MRIGPLLIASAVLIALTGCVQSGSGSPIAAPSPSATPVFASDAEALAAAEKAYAAYLKVSDEIAHDGGAKPERFATTVTKDWLVVETDSAKQLEQTGRRQVGTTGHSPLQLQRYVAGPSHSSLVAYTCLDLSATRLIDSSGIDVTPPSRRDKLPVEVAFEAESNMFLVSKNEPWSGSDFC